MKQASLLAAALCLLSSSLLHADVKLPAIFGDHMVLQQDTALPVWGSADPGEKVVVTFGKQSASATADANGKWSVKLPAVPSASDPATLTVEGKNKLTFTDVLVGDVWICSGQSNMVFPMQGAHNASTEIHKANDPGLRYFLVAHQLGIEPQSDVQAKWVVCTPGPTNGFSAVAYFFARELRSSIKHPIGLVGSYWSGLPAQAFISASGLKKDPPFTKYLDSLQKVIENYPKALAEYPALRTAFEAKLKEWHTTVDADYNKAMTQWHSDAAEAKKNGQPEPKRPEPSSPAPSAPIEPAGPANNPTVVYNGMIAPLVPYAIKGVIWYQGESNAGNAAEYQTLFPRLISDWREKWNQGDFPFLYVQLANYGSPPKRNAEGGWAWIRESQLKTLSVPNTGMAVTIDLGGVDLHPKDKMDVGLRLALAAKHVAYQQDLVYSGPIYDSMKIESNAIRLSFKDVGSGLLISSPPWSAKPAPTELTGFEIAGADQKWVWAKAKIDGDTVVVSSDQVSAPVAVRYGWSQCPVCDLYNKEGLPASPFRTDTWTK